MFGKAKKSPSRNLRQRRITWERSDRVRRRVDRRKEVWLWS